ncbi:MAG: hypothetical protein OXF27_20495 [Acidobacteria bacterium]|nr:hypothetical protein [Acidobacteriota bacterium]
MNEINKTVILAELENLERKRERLAASLHEVTCVIEVLKKTIEHFDPTSKRRVVRQEVLNVDADELRGKSLEDALIYVAKRNDGIVRSSSVRPLLVESGVLRVKQTSHALSVALRTSEYFESVTRGKYRLRDHVGDFAMGARGPSTSIKAVK